MQDWRQVAPPPPFGADRDTGALDCRTARIVAADARVLDAVLNG